MKSACEIAFVNMSSITLRLKGRDEIVKHAKNDTSIEIDPTNFSNLIFIQNLILRFKSAYVAAS